MTTHTVTPTGPAQPPAPLALDITYGPRPATRCVLCNRAMPAADRPVFELETADGNPLCLVCSDKHHKGLRLVCAVMNYAAQTHIDGDKKTAEETVKGLALALELLEETATPVPYRRPVRHQPTRGWRRDRRR